MAHDFIRFPELTNAQMDFYYFESPHKQIFEDFQALVTKVKDGDTIQVEWSERDFEFPVRFLGIDAPELNEGGEESKSWLESLIEGEVIDIKIDKKQRVGKWGRLLGKIFHRGIDIGDEMVQTGRATTFDARNEGKIPDINKGLNIKKWIK